MGSYRIEADPDGRAVLCLSGVWDDAMTSALHRVDFGYLELDQVVDWATYYVNTKDFAPFVRSARIYHLESPSGLESLVNVETLGLDVIPKPPPDLGGFKRLKKLSVYWHKKYGPALKLLPNLIGAAFYGYSEKNCQVLGEAPALRGLSLTRGGVVSLDGLQRLSITKLDLAYLRNLTDITAIARLTILQDLRIENCPSIQDISAVVGLRNLRKLFIVASARLARLASVNWISNMTDLEKVFLHDIKIEEPPDWESILMLPRLRMVGLDVPAGYGIYDDDLNAAASRAGKRLISIERIGSRKAPAIRLTLG